jgi:hypothetical protein
MSLIRLFKSTEKISFSLICAIMLRMVFTSIQSRAKLCMDLTKCVFQFNGLVSNTKYMHLLSGGSGNAVIVKNVQLLPKHCRYKMYTGLKN